MSSYFEDCATDGREENEEAAMLEDHEEGNCNPWSCSFCKDEEAEEREVLAAELAAIIVDDVENTNAATAT